MPALSQSDSELMNQELELRINENPLVWKEYSVSKQALQLISQLAIKYRVFSPNCFNYRSLDRILNVKLLDLSEMNSDFYTLETVWFAIVAHSQPFCELLSQEVQQYADVLGSAYVKVLNFFLQLNVQCSFNEVTDIGGLVAAQYPFMVSRKGLLADCTVSSVPYQRLQLSSPLLKCMCKSSANKSVLKLNRLIRDFDMAYRLFEKTFIMCIISQV